MCNTQQQQQNKGKMRFVNDCISFFPRGSWLKQYKKEEENDDDDEKKKKTKTKRQQKMLNLYV